MKHKSVLAAIVAILSAGVIQHISAAAFDFQYGTNVTPSPINPTATVGGPGSQVSQAGIGNFVTPGVPTFNAAINGTFGTDITVGTVTVTDLAIGSSYTDTYGPTPITVDLRIKDVTSGLTGDFNFTGSLSGQVASNGVTAGSAFDNPFTSTSQIQNIGGTNYEVRIIPSKDFTAPGSPPTGGSGLAGVYSFNVLAAPVPEPTTLGLMVFGAFPVLIKITRRKA